MAYSKHSESTLTPNERRAEADLLVKMLSPFVGQMAYNERTFVDQMTDERKWVSVPQLFWLRDLADRYSR